MTQNKSKFKMQTVSIEEISKLFYGVQNEAIIDKLEILNKNKEDLINSLKFIETVEKPRKIWEEYIVGKKYREEFELDEYTQNSKCLFIKNVRITGLNFNDLNYIDVMVGGQRIDRIYGFLYPMYAKEFPNNYTNHNIRKILDDFIISDIANIITEYLGDHIIIPLDVCPLPSYHTLQFRFELNDKENSQEMKNILDNIRIVFDLYEIPNQDPYTYSNYNGDIGGYAINQIQYCSDPITNISTNRFRLNFNHPSNLFGVRILGCTAKNFKFRIDGTYLLELTPSYILDNIYVFKFEKYINYSRIDNISIMMDIEEIEDIEKNKEYDIGKIDIFCISVNLFRQCSGMAGLAFSK